MRLKGAKLSAVVGSAAFAFATLASFSSANAALFSYSAGGGTDYTLVSTGANGGFNPSGTFPTGDGFGVGSTIRWFDSTNSVAGQGLLIAPQNVNITFTFMGKEAGFVNAAAAEFIWSGSPMFSNTDPVGTTSGPTTFNVGASPGIVPFMFRTTGGGPVEDAANGGGAGIGPDTRIGFWFSGSVAYAVFDDSGAGPDHDYDDMVVRMSATDAATPPVPIPGAAFLFGSVFAGGIGASQLLRRRRAGRVA